MDNATVPLLYETEYTRPGPYGVTFCHATDTWCSRNVPRWLEWTDAERGAWRGGGDDGLYEMGRIVRNAMEREYGKPGGTETPGWVRACNARGRFYEHKNRPIPPWPDAIANAVTGPMFGPTQEFGATVKAISSLLVADTLAIEAAIRHGVQVVKAKAKRAGHPYRGHRDARGRFAKAPGF